MELFVVSFVAGVLTILAPCILPLLPIIIGGSAINGSKDWRAPVVITASLAVSVIVFSLLLKASTALLGIPATVWQIISGVIVIAFGLNLLLPTLWERAGAKFNLSSNKLLAKASQKTGQRRNILIGAALGPVFSSCSPTYALIVAVILPRSFAEGVGYLIAYAVGLSAILLLIGFAGQQIVGKLQWASNPRGWFKRTIGILFIVVGIAVLLGLDKWLQTTILESGLYDPISNFEQNLMH